MHEEELQDDSAASQTTDHPMLANQTLAQIEQSAMTLLIDEPEAELLRWLNLSAVLLAKAREIRRQVEQVAVGYITANGPVDCGNIRYTVGHTKVVSCIDVQRCTQQVLAAVGGDLHTLTTYYRSEPFKYGSVRQLLGGRLFDQLFRVEVKPKLIEGKPQKQLIRHDRRFLTSQD